MVKADGMKERRIECVEDKMEEVTKGGGLWHCIIHCGSEARVTGLWVGVKGGTAFSFSVIAPFPWQQQQILPLTLTDSRHQIIGLALTERRH